MQFSLKLNNLEVNLIEVETRVEGKGVISER